MSQKELKYSGFSAVPSDYECPDGSLAMALNLVPEDGTLRPAGEPDIVFTLPSSQYSVIFIHKNSGYTHYIIAKMGDNRLFWVNASNTKPTEELILSQTIYNFGSSVTKVESIGNTLIVLTDKALHYLLWKSENNAYTYLGTKIPFPVISLSLGCAPMENSIQSYSDELRLCSATYTDINNSVNGYLGNKFGSSGGNSTTYFYSNRDPKIVELKKSFADQILGSANLFIAEQMKAGNFTEPFFVRYALRLYNGSHTMHSAPILMIPNSSFRAVITNVSLDEDSFTASTTLAHYISRLLFKIIDDANIQQWSDIVTHVDFFISTPIYTYDQSKEELDIEVFKNHRYTGSTDGPSKFFSFSHIGQYGYTEAGTRAEEHRQPSDPIKNPVISFDSGNYEIYYDYELPTEGARWDIERKRSDIETDIKGQAAALYYLLKSFEIDKVKVMENYSIVNDESMSLENIQTRERLEDDYQSHHSILPSFTYTFNGRLHLANIRQQLFSGFQIDTSTQQTLPNPDDADNSVSRVKVYIKVKKEGGSQWLIENVGLQTLPYKLGEAYFPRWLFYPDSGATQMIIVEYAEDGNTIIGYWNLPLTAHESLEGAYWFRGLATDLPDYEETSSLPAEISNAIRAGQENIIYLNKIYTSEVYNPFYFPVSNIVTVGTGKILGICSAARPLSQGQFGQFPLYAFTDEGVWALEVSDTGTYSARQPITRDVCSNPDSICPIDSAVLFTTDRGIMLISGSNVSSISDSLNGDSPFNIITLPAFKSLIDNYAPDLSKSIYNILSWRPNVTYYPFPNRFSHLLPSLRLMYDYTNQRILAFVPVSNNSGYHFTPCFIYSLNTKSWGLADYEIESPVNSYPDAMAMNNNGELLNFSNKSVSVRPLQLLVSRPFKLDAPDTFKTIDTIIQRGYFRKGHVKTVLYGSRDLFSWHLIWSSQDHYLRGFRGTPYKYFRLALLCNLSADESIYGATVQYTPRLMNQPR